MAPGLEQLVELVDLGGVEFGRAPSSIGDGPAFLENLLGRLQCLLLVEQGALASSSTSRRCSAVASADRRLAACATKP